MKRKLRVERAVGTGVVVIGGLGCLVIGNLLAQDYNTVEPVSGPIETTSSVVATTETTTTVKHYTQTFPISAALSSTTETTEQPVPLYIYKDETVTREYSSWIQEELYRQYTEFEGELPPYTMVLSLLLKESSLNPYKVSEDGSTSGLGQLSNLTLMECERRGWYDPQQDNYSENVLTQIDLTLKVLNWCCEECPGGEYPYYRAIRAYYLGVSGLESVEDEGMWGAEESWYEGEGGNWYPGNYGKIKEIEKYLVLVE